MNGAVAALVSGGLALALAGCSKAPDPAPTWPAVSAGARAYQKCYACHAIEPGKNDITGPTLHAIVGRRIAAEPGVEYSAALRAFAAQHPQWTEQLIDSFVADPEGLVPGTSMSFHGIKDEAERAALISYLREPEK